MYKLYFNSNSCDFSKGSNWLIEKHQPKAQVDRIREKAMYEYRESIAERAPSLAKWAFWGHYQSVDKALEVIESYQNRSKNERI